MPNKVKPTWICQHCTRPFTTKYSLMRHFKRFPEHAPPNLNDGSDTLKPVTVTLEDGVRTVQAGPNAMAQLSSSASKASDTTPHQRNSRRVSTGSMDSVESHPAVSVAPTSVVIQSVPVVEQTPSTPGGDIGTPITGEISIATDKGNYPFLPPFLEDEQILDIATPQQKQNGPPLHHPASSTISTPMTLPPHMSAAATLHSPLWPGDNLLSPLAPACNIGQVFAQENLRPLAANSPLEMEALNNSLLMGEDEVTSPLNFLEKTCAMTTSLDFLSPPKQRPVDVTNDSMVI